MAARRTLEVPTTLPGGSSATVVAPPGRPARITTTSPGLPRGPTAETLQPLGSFVGTSFKLCTMQSMSPRRRRTSNSSVQRDLPVWARVCRGVVWIWSPVVVVGWMA